MSEELDFGLRLQDHLSKASGDAASALREVEAEMRKVEIQTLRLELAQKRAQVGPRTLADATREHALALKIQRAELVHQQTALKSHENSVGKLAQGFQALGKVATGALFSIGERLVDVALSAPGLAVAGARFALDALAFKESALASYELMLGGKEQARKMFDSNLFLAKKTPFETADVVDAMKAIMSGGFDQEEANILFQAIGDVSAASGFNKQIFGQLSLVFSQIKSAGKLQGQDFRQVLNATAGAGVGTAQIFGQIAKLKGIKAADVQAAMSKGNVSSMEGIVGIVNAIKEKSGGRVGEIMLRQSSTLKGLFSTLSSAPMDFFMSMDLDKLEGLNPFKKFIDNLVGDEGVLNTATASGKRIHAVLERTFNQVFGGIFGPLSSADGKARLEAGIGSLVEGFGSFVSGIGAFGSGFAKGFAPFISFFGGLDDSKGKAAGFTVAMGKLGSSLGSLVAAVGTFSAGAAWVLDGFFSMFDPARNPAHPLNLIDNLKLVGQKFQWWWADIKNWFKNLWLDAKNLAADLVMGFVSGIEEKLGLPAGAAVKMASATVSSVRDALGIHSPSRVFAEVGANVARGYVSGVEGGTPDSVAAAREMVGPPGLAAAGRGGSGVTVIVHAGALQVVVQGGSADAEGMYQRLATQLRAALPDLLEAAVVEAGLLGVGGA